MTCTTVFEFFPRLSVRTHQHEEVFEHDAVSTFGDRVHQGVELIILRGSEHKLALLTPSLPQTIIKDTELVPVEQAILVCIGSSPLGRDHCSLAVSELG